MPIAAVGQFCATEDVANNARICCDLIERASKFGAKMIFLPEAADFVSSGEESSSSIMQSKEPLKFVEKIKEQAKKSKIWVSLTVHEPIEGDKKMWNTHYVINDEGKEEAFYHKAHLMSMMFKEGPQMKESDSTHPGEEIGQPVQTPLGKLGLQMCYDMRFAEPAIMLRQRGAEILAYPSAFTVNTGMAHWEPLLKARAIETQSFVIAAAQIGQHNEKRSTYGHAMIIDPWGTVIAQCPSHKNDPSIAIANIDLDYLSQLREEMPVIEDRRVDLYAKLG
ncbi:carbon-nitrogen hydrolase [Blakeslea trispora]|nr:carbon-nitrogen hydrolase [Blakeslea trispora]